MIGQARDKLAEDFLRYLAVERNASPRTLKAYRKALSAFRKQNQKPWKQCSPEDFRDYLFTIMKRNQARSYVRLQFSALRAFYKFLTDRKKLRIDPVRQIQLPKIDKRLPLVLTRQQIDGARSRLNGEPGVLDVLINDGDLSEVDVSRTLAAQAHMDWIDLSSIVIPPGIIKQIRAEDARRFKELQDREKWSATDVIRETVREYHRRSGKPRKSAWEIMSESRLIGALKGAPRDL